MKIITVTLAILLHSVHGLVLPRTLKPLTARVTLSPSPIVYVYDHCPFCVRVRLAFGLKNIKHEVRFLANDDGTCLFLLYSLFNYHHHHHLLFVLKF
jgi:hypothetical protein